MAKSAELAKGVLCQREARFIGVDVEREYAALGAIFL